MLGGEPGFQVLVSPYYSNNGEMELKPNSI